MRAINDGGLNTRMLRVIYIIVELEIREPHAFVSFETKAVSIMKKYNGRLVTAFELNRQYSSSTNANEVHVLQFDSQLDFENYRNDEEIKGLVALRKKAIANTTVLVQGIEKTYE